MTTALRAAAFVTLAGLATLTAVADPQGREPGELAAVREQIRNMERSLQALVRQQTDLAKEQQRLEADCPWP